MGREWKVSAFTLTDVVWVIIVVRYQDIWIVSCNFGNGAKNIFASLCASLVLAIICRVGRVE